MLVLTRKLNQSIMIGEIEVTVAEVREDGERGGNAQVRLGINAPRDVTVDRKEIWLEKQGEGKRQENEAVSHV